MNILTAAWQARAALPENHPKAPPSIGLSSSSGGLFAEDRFEGVRSTVQTKALTIPKPPRKASQDPKDKPHYYVMSRAAFNTLPASMGIRPLRGSSERVLIKLTDDQLAQAHHHLHQKGPRIGGILDVTDIVRDREGRGLDPFVGLINVLERVPQSVFEAPTREYNAQIEAVGKHLNMERFKDSLTEFVKFPTRHARAESGVAAALWLRDRAQEAVAASGRSDIEVSLVKTEFPSYEQPSVLIRIPGSTRKPGVLIGGHLDTVRPFTGSQPRPGADDDGSGTMTSLETLRAILESGLRFERDIYVAFYAAEEVGLVGSRNIANKFLDEDIPLRAAIQFDMTGFDAPADRHEMYLVTDYTNREATEYTRQLAKRVLGIEPQDVGSTRCTYACSDHASWHKIGVPAVFPFETNFSNMNEKIHTADDTMDRLNFEHMEKYLRLGAAFITELAEPITEEISKS